MTAKLEGDWGKTLKLLEGVGQEVMEAAKKGLYQGGLLIEACIVGHLQNQDLGWEKLNEAYKAWKERKGLSNQIGIATSTMLNSAATIPLEDGSEVFVGFKREKKRPDGEDPVLIAEVFEFGSKRRNIPARPLLQPSFKETLPAAQNRVQVMVEKALKRVAEKSQATSK